MIAPSNYLPSIPSEFLGKTRRIAEVLFKKADKVRANNGCAKWLFTGPPGLGKSRLADVLANRIAPQRVYIEPLNGQSLSVERVRDWERSLYYRSTEMNVKLIDELDSMSAAALNEMRTFLDRIKDGWVVIATTNKTLRELPDQMQSRFFTYPFDPISPEDFATFMKDMYGMEYNIALDIGRRNKGCVRSALIDAESIMDANSL